MSADIEETKNAPIKKYSTPMKSPQKEKPQPSPTPFMGVKKQVDDPYLDGKKTPTMPMLMSTQTPMLMPLPILDNKTEISKLKSDFDQALYMQTIA